MLPALKRGDNVAVEKHLRAFKERGVVRHDKTLRIPSSERIPALTKSDEGYEYVMILLVARLKTTFEGMNLRKGMNEDQIIELGVMIIEQSHEDNLSVEDVLLFLQMLLAGKVGKIFDRMDIPTFFELFEVYRQQRHMELQYIQYEIEAQYKGMGDNSRTSDGRMENDANTRQVMSDYFRKTQYENNTSNPIQQTPTP